MTTQSLGENLLTLKTNIEMRLGSKLQEMGWDLGNGENKIVIFKLKMPTSRYFIIIVSIARNTAEKLKYYQYLPNEHRYSSVSKVVLNYVVQCDKAFLNCRKIRFDKCKYRASHISLISEFILYATKNTNDADHLIPFIMRFNLVINLGM
jgi:hypothetical protein